MRSLLFAVTLLTLAPLGAAAQASLDRAERQLEEAQFERAAETLAEVADGVGPLDREGVARLLRLRAVVGMALGREQAVRRDLLGLAAVLGAREPGPMPDALMRQLDQARAEVDGPPSVRVRIDDQGDARRAVVQVGADPGGLVRGTRLACDADGRELGQTEAAELDLPADGAVRCVAQALGPGGWVVDSAEARRSGGGLGGGGGDGDLLPWLIGGIGAAVLAAVIIGIAVGVSAPRGVGGPEWVP